MGEVEQAFSDADITLLLIDVAKDPHGNKSLNHEFVKMRMRRKNKSTILILNKIDLISQQEAKELLNFKLSDNIFQAVIFAFGRFM